MSNEYKEWLKEQTFESLANDNLRIKLELQTAKEENEKLNRVTSICCAITHKESADWQDFVKTHNDDEISEEFKRFCNEKDLRLTIQNLTQQNKQMRENINNIKNLCNEDWEDMTVDKFQNQLLQALKEVNNEK